MKMGDFLCAEDLRERHKCLLMDSEYFNHLTLLLIIFLQEVVFPHSFLKELHLVPEDTPQNMVKPYQVSCF